MNEHDLIIRTHLNGIVVLSKSIITGLLSQNVILFELQTIEEKEIEGFTYGNTGAWYERSSHSFKQIKNWTKACIEVSHIVSVSEPFIALDQLVKEQYPNQYQTNVLQQYAFKLFYLLFKNGEPEQEHAIDNLNTILLNQLNEVAQITKGVVYLSGVILQRDIPIEKGHLLRRTIKTDLEKPQTLLNQGLHLPLPSAVLEIEMHLKESQRVLLQEQITLFTQLLRLFNVGSVNYKYYEIHVETITGAHMTSGSPHGFLYSWKQYVLPPTDEKRFIYFVTNLLKDKNLLDSNKSVNHVNIAFDRYSEALLENISIERRIANAVMGMEALLSDPTPEIKFKLSMRLSKLLSFFGFLPLVVKSYVSRAYDIRSSYAHGGHLSVADKNKLEANYGGTDHFTTTILNYLRICLVATVAAGIKKKELISELDDSLLDKDASEKLAADLQPAQAFLFN